MQSSRRDFLVFMGSQVAMAGGVAALLNSVVTGCATTGSQPQKIKVSSIRPSDKDELVLASGLAAKVLIKWDDPINSKQNFGTNNDYIAMVKDEKNPDEFYLWVNHESVQPLLVSGFDGSKPKTKAQVIKEQLAVGGSILKVKNGPDGWEVIKNHPKNKRITGRTPIPFSGGTRIGGSTKAIGTIGNCAGGVTPWNTFLTCEENYQDFYGQIEYDESNKPQRKPSQDVIGWEKHFPENPEHYGWVVEVNPVTGTAKKLVSMGRFSHECATTTLASDGRTVVYMGDDANDQCLYKFISAKPGSLETGELFVADTINGKWLSLDREKSPVLKNKFKNQLEVMIRCREAAKLVGATALNRPEDVEIHPFTKEIFFTQTNNKKKGDFHGQITKISETDSNPLSMTFVASTFVTGGEKSGISCPDNLVFDNKGNLWVTADVADEAMNKPPYDKFKNNALFMIPTSGPSAGELFRLASAPTDAEFTGPMFSPDFKTLFLSVQHPGEGSTSLDGLTSHWPEGGSSIPRSAVVTISGPALEAITG